VFHIRKFKLKDFKLEAEEPTGCINGWKVYGWCSEGNLSSCELLARAKLMEVLDAKHLLSGMAKLIGLACVGKPLKDMYDSKKCHESFTFTRNNGVEEKIHRIWPSGDMRIYFCYGSNKTIIVFYGLSKRKDKLTDGEKSELQVACEAFLTAQEQNKLIILE
jgi:hypothetical protein